jgi:uncharacterized membrane protein YkoI
MNVRRIATTAAAATLTLLVLGGTAYALGTDDIPTVTAVPAASVTDTTTTAAAPPTDDRIPVDRAREIAVAAVGGGEVTKVESELEHGRLQWKVDVRSSGTTHEVRIDAATGDVVGQSGTTTAPTTTTAPRPAPRIDDRPGHDVGDDKGGDRVRSDDGARHDAGDDHGDRHGGDDSGHSGRH